MPLTNQQQIDAARALAQQLFVQAAATANVSHADLAAAVAQIDTDFDTNLNAAVTAFGGATTVINALNASLPEPVKSTLTGAQKTVVCCYVLMKRAGLV